MKVKLGTVLIILAILSVIISDGDCFKYMGSKNYIVKEYENVNDTDKKILEALDKGITGDTGMVNIQK